MKFLVLVAVICLIVCGAWLYWGEDIKDFLANLLD